MSNGILFSAPLLAGDEGTSDTIDVIRSLVDDAWRNAHIEKFAVQIVRDAGAPQFDDLNQARAIYEWVHGNIYFVNDPVTKQALKPALDMLYPENRYGNCANINATLLPALLGAIGIETRLVTIAAQSDDPNAFSHVYAEAFIKGSWFPLDAARPNAAFGIAPDTFYRRKWWSLTDDSSGDYPAGTTLSGGPRRLRGLGNLTTDLGLIFSGASSVLRSVSGQTVVPVSGNLIGAGGAMSVSPTVLPSGAASVTPILLIAGVGLLLWSLSK